MSDGQLSNMQLIGNLDIGGAQEVVRTLAQELTQAGCRTIVCAFRDGPLRQEIERLGIPVEIIPGRRHSILALPLFLAEMVRIRRDLARLAAGHQVAIVQTHLLRTLDFLTLTLRFRTPVRLVFWTVHNSNFALRAEQLPGWRWLLGPKRLAHRLLYRLAARWVSGFVAVSDEVRTAIFKTIGPVDDKISVICNGVDVQRYRQPGERAALRQALGLAEDARLALVVGTLKEQKGHRYLIEAAAPLIADDPGLHLIFAGDGPLRSQLEGQVGEAGLSGRVHFLGNRSDVPALLAASDYFVLPSLWEGLPMALIEAMASGRPIVATEVSGTRQVMLDGETGLLVPPGDSARLRDALRALLGDDALAAALAAAAQHRVEALFSARKQAEEHIALYRRALARLDRSEPAVEVTSRP